MFICNLLIFFLILTDFYLIYACVWYIINKIRPERRPEMNSPDNPHKNHRRRVKEAVSKNGAFCLPDDKLLEYLLFYTVPRRDTLPAARELIDRYGSLGGVLNAPREELESIAGIGESSALFLSSLPAVCARYGGEAASYAPGRDPAQAIDSEVKAVASLSEESFRVISLDAAGLVIACDETARGDISSVTVDKRALVRTVLSRDADSVILLHNHPGGASAPSAEDIALTAELARLLAEVGVTIADHIICGEDGLISLSSLEKFSYLFSRG